MISDVLEQATELRRAGQPFVLATVVARKRPQSVRPGSSAIILPDGTMRGWVGGGCVRPAVLREARAALEDGQPRLVRLDPASSGDGEWEGVLDYPMTCQGEGAVEVYLEPMLPRPALLVLGRTPVAQAVVRFGSALGFRVTAAEPAAREELFPDADAVLTDWADAARRIGADGFVVVATMGEDDEGALEAAAASEARHIGLVASRKKGDSLIAYLRSRGVDAERAARIKYPAGLDLGAVGPDEVALSIMAEIVQLRRARAGARAGAREWHEGGGDVGGEYSPTRTRTPTRARARPSSPESEPEPESDPGRSEPGTGSPSGRAGGHELDPASAPNPRPEASRQSGSARPGAVHAHAGVAVPPSDRAPLAPARAAAPGMGGASAPARARAAGPGEAVDPVCGMVVEVAASRHSIEHGGRTFHFCCPRCMAAFGREPERYAPAAAG
ncbi:MAG TPA: XdhC family protein [Longimicrobiales bacterium]